MEMEHVSLGTLQLGAPWGLHMTDFGAPTLYGLISGPSCWLGMPDAAPLAIGTGDVMLLSGATSYTLSSGVDGPFHDFGDAWAANMLPSFDATHEPSAPLRFVWGGEGERTLLLGLAFRLVDGLPGPLVAALPDVTLVRAGEGYFPWIASAVEHLAHEDAAMPGYTVTARLLSELMFVSIVRHHLASEADTSRGWLRGLGDPAIASALQVIHANPAQDWTVRSLADAAGVSRSTFATRFNHFVGMPPIQYLTHWRMHLAATRLRQPKTNLSQIAFHLGYASDAAFRDAFRRFYGDSPSRYRSRFQPGTDLD